MLSNFADLLLNLGKFILQCIVLENIFYLIE